MHGPVIIHIQTDFRENLLNLFFFQLYLLAFRRILRFVLHQHIFRRDLFRVLRELHHFGRFFGIQPVIDYGL